MRATFHEDENGSEDDDEGRETRGLLEVELADTSSRLKISLPPATAETKALERNKSYYSIFLALIALFSISVIAFIQPGQTNHTQARTPDLNAEQVPAVFSRRGHQPVPSGILVTPLDLSFVDSIQGCWKKCLERSMSNSVSAADESGSVQSSVAGLCAGGDWLFLATVDVSVQESVDVVAGSFIPRASFLALDNTSCSNMPGSNCEVATSFVNGVHWYVQDNTVYDYHSLGFSPSEHVTLSWALGYVARDFGPGCERSTCWSWSAEKKDSVIGCTTTTDSKFHQVILHNTCPVLLTNKL